MLHNTGCGWPPADDAGQCWPKDDGMASDRLAGCILTVQCASPVHLYPLLSQGTPVNTTASAQDFTLQAGYSTAAARQHLPQMLCERCCVLSKTTGSVGGQPAMSLVQPLAWPVSRPAYGRSLHRARMHRSPAGPARYWLPAAAGPVRSLPGQQRSPWADAPSR